MRLHSIEYGIYFEQDPNKKAIEEEYDFTFIKLDSIWNTKYEDQYFFDTNVYRYITKDLSYKSMGVRFDDKPHMFVFTITKGFSLTWEIYLEYYEEEFSTYILDLLRVTHHIYFIGVTEDNCQKFENFWYILKYHFLMKDHKIDYAYEKDYHKYDSFDNNINLRSIILIPYAPRATLTHVFKKKILETTVVNNILWNNKTIFYNSSILW